jgi:hypothetical protein
MTELQPTAIAEEKSSYFWDEPDHMKHETDFKTPEYSKISQRGLKDLRILMFTFVSLV